MDLEKQENNKISYWLQKLHLQSVDNAGANTSETKELVKKTEKYSSVEDLMKKSNNILLRIQTHKWPFDFFPNVIAIEEGRVSIIIRNSFFSSDVHSLDVKDISNIFISVGVIYAKLTIISRTFSETSIDITFLWKKEAIHARRIIEGLRIFEKHHINTSMYSKKDLIEKLEALSTTTIIT